MLLSIDSERRDDRTRVFNLPGEELGSSLAAPNMGAGSVPRNMLERVSIVRARPEGAAPFLDSRQT